MTYNQSTPSPHAEYVEMAINSGNMKVGKLAAKRLSELEPQDDALYVLLSNIYAAAGQWDDVANARKIMKDCGVKKESGYSWIEVKNRVYVFVVEDRS